MARRGEGYGSEDHLRRSLDDRPSALTEEVADQLGVPAADLAWLGFPYAANGQEREFHGLEFLSRETHEDVLKAWRTFWPPRGRAQTWDAIGQARDQWLLVEAKANHPEFCSPPTTAKDGRQQIERALGRVKRDLGVHRFFDWTGTYYQYANRLTALWFLVQQRVPASLVFVYFTGDIFPDGTPCPASREDWARLIEARRLTLGLPRHHRLSGREHHVFLPCLPRARA